MIFNSMVSAADAQILCQAESPEASLMVADSQEEFDFLVRYLEFASPVEVLWTGLVVQDDTATGTRFAAMRDQTRLSADNFASNVSGGAYPYIDNEPDGAGTTCILHVVRTGSTAVGGYRDIECDRPRRFVCERADFDPKVPATAAVTPVPTLTFDNDGYVIDPATGNGVYKLVDGERRSHSGAEAFCASDVPGGHLAYPLTADERDFLQTYLNARSAAQVLWIGGVVNDPAVGDFTFTSGVAPGSFSYDAAAKTFKAIPDGAFESDEPNEVGRACLLHVVSAGAWRDIDCAKPRAWVCQR